ncbi:MAG TPA: hypothetical protein VFZ97_20150 [Acidimicrobiales bacterium]
MGLYAVLWSADDITDAEPERADEMRAEVKETRAALDAGEAVLLDEPALRARLLIALDAWKEEPE